MSLVLGYVKINFRDETVAFISDFDIGNNHVGTEMAEHTINNRCKESGSTY